MSKFDGTKWITYTISEGLAGNSVEAIAIASEGNIWFGTSGGVSKCTITGTSWSLQLDSKKTGLSGTFNVACSGLHEMNVNLTKQQIP